MIQQLGLIGCGLMGGSLALALKRAGLVQRVVGFSPSQRTRQTALELGVIDHAVSSAAEAAQGSDVVLVAGKGHEDYQDVAGVKHPFSDIEVAEAGLQARGTV